MEQLRTHQPKGGMCGTCAWQQRNCEALLFEAMPVIGVDTATWANIVRCTEHTPLRKYPATNTVNGVDAERRS